MATDKTVYGLINCPHCGYVSGMRITADKTGAPFGFCEANCGGQLRIGGSQHRVREFFKANPHIKRAFDAVSGDEKEPQKPVTVTGKKDDFLDNL